MKQSTITPIASSELVEKWGGVVGYLVKGKNFDNHKNE